LIAEITFKRVAYELIERAVKQPRLETVRALERCASREKGLARMQVREMLESMKTAAAEQTLICQDTGVPVFYVSLGRGMSLDFDVRQALSEAVRDATERVPLRRNVVHPLTRRNSGTNTGMGMPHVFFDLTGDDFAEITFVPRGCGSENMSRLRMFVPTSPLAGIKRFVLECAVDFVGKPCPPYTLGIGIGGTSDIALMLAKKVMLREGGSSDKRAAALERDLAKRINSLGIGPMGLGGRCTALAVRVETLGTHTGTLPVAVATQCYPNRHAKARLWDDGKIAYL
jgi:fumarate hydratase subunit alpha